MVVIIETNASVNQDGLFEDFQSRVIEVTSWNDYCEEIKNAKSINRDDAIGCLHGRTLPKESEVDNVYYDDHHLHCAVKNGSSVGVKLAYLAKIKD